MLIPEPERIDYTKPRKTILCTGCEGDFSEDELFSFKDGLYCEECIDGMFSDYGKEITTEDKIEIMEEQK